MAECMRFAFAVALVVAAALSVDAGSPLAWSTYVGGSGSDIALGVAIDGAGGAAIVGSTSSSCSGWERMAPSGTEGLVARFDAAGKLVYRACVGGKGIDVATAAAFLGDDLIIVGRTNSPDFPTTEGALYRGPRGSNDGFLARLDPEGKIVYATYLGGIGMDVCSAVLARDGIVNLAGWTASPDFPVTEDGLQRALGGSTDVFLARLDLSRSGAEALVYATYLGGEAEESSAYGGPGSGVLDGGPSIALLPDGSVAIAGRTRSPDFPVSPNVPPPRGDLDAFVARVDPSAGPYALVFAATLGGSAADAANDIAVEEDGTLVVLGETMSSDFPTTAGSYQEPSGGDDIFLARIVPDPDAIAPFLHTSCIAGDGWDQASAVVSDGPGLATVLLTTNSKNLPVTPGAFDADPGIDSQDDELFLAKLHLDSALPPREQVLYATYLGGSASDVAAPAMARDGGSVWIGATTRSPDFPTTPGAFQPSHSNAWDAALVRFDLRIPAVDFILEGPDAEGYVTVHARCSTPEGTGELSYEWDFGEGFTIPGPVAGYRYHQVGVHTIRLLVRNEIGLAAAKSVAFARSCTPADLWPWVSADVGSPVISGAGWMEHSTLVLCAGGTTPGSSEDRYHVVAREAAGDSFVQVHIAAVEGECQGAAVGLLVRESLDPSASYAAVVLESTGSGCAARFRYRDGEEADYRAGSPLPHSCCLRLERRGQEIVAASSADGERWEEVTRFRFEQATLPDLVLAGAFAYGVETEGAGTIFPVSARLEDLRVAPLGATFIRGDADASGAVEITDPIAIFQHLFLGGEMRCALAADANDDEAINIGDGIFALDFLFRGGSSPGFPALCAGDPTEGPLECAMTACD